MSTITRWIPANVRPTYQALISQRRGTGPLPDLPFGCSVSWLGRNWIVAGFDEEEQGTFVRLVDRACRQEVLRVDPKDLTKTTSSPWLR